MFPQDDGWKSPDFSKLKKVRFLYSYPAKFGCNRMIIRVRDEFLIHSCDYENDFQIENFKVSKPIMSFGETCDHTRNLRDSLQLYLIFRSFPPKVATLQFEEFKFTVQVVIRRSSPSFGALAPFISPTKWRTKAHVFSQNISLKHFSVWSHRSRTPSEQVAPKVFQSTCIMRWLLPGVR